VINLAVPISSDVQRNSSIQESAFLENPSERSRTAMQATNPFETPLGFT